MTLSKRLNRAYAKLVEIRAEQVRQMAFAGERFGIFAKLNELDAHERRVVARIERLTP